MQTATNFDQLPTPDFVRDMLDWLAPAKADRPCREREYKLSYYYGGFVVAAEATPAGLMIVASGPAHELGQVFDQLSKPEFERLVFLFPDPISAHLAGLPRRPAAG
ncbi:MAG TPA: hypothetical protein VH092_18380 [Urbifossiella sp.]|nr:hypothetical protein [Urbifossiella sp.]